ncbi:hypothetical protein GA0116948_10515 [Chitinophaga costaii]|uniref:Uncharacterized protein n=1 Tax=Chitinophaga costaii TaxID=1335309 RepID=A0A1C4D173_9BACT|nr:hypothetical protein GA0116948_10515 [Chitinophaga costaii]
MKRIIEKTIASIKKYRYYNKRLPPYEEDSLFD